MLLPLLLAFVVADAPVAAAAEAPPDPTPPHPATPAPPPPPGRERVLVLDLQGVGVDEDTTRTVNGVVASIVSESPTLDVATSADLRTLVDVSVQKQSIGCDASSCLGDLAGAFGARYILYGDLGRLDADVVVNVSLYDAGAATAVSRASVTVKKIGDVRQTLRPQLAELLKPVGGLPPEVKTTSPLLIGGAIGAGVGVVVAVIGGAIAGVAEATAGNPDADIKDKQDALGTGATGLVVAGVGLGVGIAGGALAAVTLVLEAE